MRTDQLRLLCAALAIFALLAAPVALAGSSDRSGASQSAAKHKPDLSAELKKLKRKLAAYEKASTEALQAAIADWEKNTEAVSGGFGLLKAPLGGVLTGVFPGNVQIVDESITGADIGSEAVTTEKIAEKTIRGGDIFDGTITGGASGDIAAITINAANVNSSQIQLRGMTSACTGTNKMTELSQFGSVACSPDLGSRDSVTVTSGTSPSVAGVSTVLFNYGPLTGLADLTGAAEGQQVTLIAVAATVSVGDAAPFKLSGGWLPTADDTLTLVKSGPSWYEVSRSAN
jgi:hypothetical protein